jgi:2-polyprenyl-3-methyl-5-hydroxy-6-metoxy-1,4-benzoquinol methylase
MDPRASRACPLCQCADVRPFRFRLVECTACGLVRDDAAMAREVEANAEAFDQDSFAEPSGWVRHLQQRNARKSVAEIAKAVAPGAEVLEIGPGFGALAVELVRHGYKVTIADTSAAVCGAVKRRERKIETHLGPIASMQGRRFDLVVASHVLEHVGEPVAFLEAVRTLLAPAGVAWISVPNVRSPEAALPGWTSYEPYHLTYFGPAQLRRAMERAGLRIDRIWTTEPYSGWPLAVLRTALQRGKPRHWNQSPVGAGAETVRGRAAVETAYRLAMFASGGTIYPLRIAQAAAGYGENLLALVRRAS